MANSLPPLARARAFCDAFALRLPILMAPMAGASLWDYQGYSLVEAPVELARAVGALDRLPMLLNHVVVLTELSQPSSASLSCARA